MKRTLKTTLAASAAAMIATATMAMTPIEEIEVTADMEAVANYEAATIWQSLPEDLERRLETRLNADFVEGGGKIEVDIDEISLANNFEQVAGLEDAELAGKVTLYGVGGYFDEAYDLSVSALDVLQYIPEENRIVAPNINSVEIYSAMLDGFADNVVEKLQ